MDWHPVISVQQQTPDNDFCHFSISNVRFAFWAFFWKPEKLGSHTWSKWRPGDPDVKDDPNDPLTRLPNDPVPCLTTSVNAVTDADVCSLLEVQVQRWMDSPVKEGPLKFWYIQKSLWNFIPHTLDFATASRSCCQQNLSTVELLELTYGRRVVAHIRSVGRCWRLRV